MKRNILIGVLIIVILVLIFAKGCNQNKTSLEQRYGQELIEAMADTLDSFRDKENRQISYIRVLVGDKISLKDTISIRDKTIKWLMSVGDRESKATNIVVMKTTTKLDTVTKTIIESVFDTVFADGSILLYPTYVTEWDKKWSRGNITANKDSIKHVIEFKNEFEIWQQMDKKKGFFSKKVLKVYVRNNNPFTSTDNLRSWTVKRKRKNFVFGVGIGYGVTIPDFKPMPYIGVQLQFKIFEF